MKKEKSHVKYEKVRMRMGEDQTFGIDSIVKRTDEVPISEKMVLQQLRH